MKSIIGKTLILLLMIGFTVNLDAQKNPKLDRAIEALDDTEFVDKYRGYKYTIEVSIEEFKVQADDLDLHPDDIEDVATAFESAKEKFDKILSNLGSDLLDKDTREYIIGEPSRYTRFISSELEDAFEHYQDNVVALMDELTDYETAGFGLGEIQLLFSLVTEVTGALKGMNKDMSEMTAEYFEDNFLGKLRLKSWNDI